MSTARKNVIVLLLVLISSNSFSQIGGQRSFEFLNVPVNATITALGGNNISLIGKDPSMLMVNPALTDSLSSGQISFGYLGYFAGVNQSTVTYVHEIRNRPVSFGVNYLNYGDLEGFDPTGNSTGDFQARDYVISVGSSHKVGVFTLGGNVKLAHSLIDTYSSSALLFDVGGIFRPGGDNWVVSLVAQNLGWILSEYTGQTRSALPFDIRLGTTFKPEFMPVRFSFTATNLVRENVAFSNPSLNPNDGEPGAGDAVLRRLNIGAELLLGKGLRVLLGYNHRIRRELRLQQLSGGAGFSFGMFLRIKMFELTYARSTFHAAGGVNHVTIVTNFKKFKKAKL